MRYFSTQFPKFEVREGLDAVFRSTCRGVIVTDIDLLRYPDDIRELLAYTHRMSLISLEEYGEETAALNAIRYLESRLATYAEEHIVKLAIKEVSDGGKWVVPDSTGPHFLRVIVDILPEGTAAPMFNIEPSRK